jgi:hypothetical protein
LSLFGGECWRLGFRGLRPAIAGACVHIAGGGHFDDMAVPAQRASDDASFALLVEVRPRGEPSLEAVIVGAQQIENFHVTNLP